jgi:hypothetical protein
VVRGQDAWLVMIPGVLPAYITVEAYHANLARPAANAARAETPAWYGRGRRCCRGWRGAGAAAGA